MADKALLSGTVRVWGGSLTQTQWCHIDKYGCFDGGPELECQDEIEEQIADGQRSGETEGGYCWEYIG